MLQIFKSTDAGMITLDQVENGAWINLVNPSERKSLMFPKNLKIPVEHIKAALDEEERARIEVDEDCTVVLIDTPVPNEKAQERGVYYTVPLGIIIADKNIVTVSLRENYIINDFIDRKIKSFYTFKKTRFFTDSLQKFQIVSPLPSGYRQNKWSD